MLTQVLRLDTIETAPFDGSAQTKTFTYKWKRPMNLRTFFFMGQPGVFINDQFFAQISVSIQDQEQWFFATTGRATAFVEALALHGKGRRWFPLNKDVKSGDIWTIQVKSLNGQSFTPVLLFEVDDVGKIKAA